MKEFADGYSGAYQILHESKPVTCSITGTTFDALPAPCAAIIDVSVPSTLISTTYDRSCVSTSQFFCLPHVQITRAISGHSVPIIACVAAGAAAIVRLFGPESIGGVGDFGARIDAEVARTGLSPDEIGPKVHISVFIF